MLAEELKVRHINFLKCHRRSVFGDGLNQLKLDLLDDETFELYDLQRNQRDDKIEEIINYIRKRPANVFVFKMSELGLRSEILDSLNEEFRNNFDIDAAEIFGNWFDFQENHSFQLNLDDGEIELLNEHFNLLKVVPTRVQMRTRFDVAAVN